MSFVRRGDLIVRRQLLRLISFDSMTRRQKLTASGEEGSGRLLGEEGLVTGGLVGGETSGPGSGKELVEAVAPFFPHHNPHPLEYRFVSPNPIALTVS